MGLVGTAICGSIMGIKEVTKTKEYKTTTTTYDTSQEEPTSIIEYLPSISDSVSLIEYSQWEEPGYYRDDYKRNVYTYNLNNLEVTYDNIQDYLTEDIKDYIQVTEQVETSSEKPEEEYSGNKYVITQTIQDKSDYQKKDDPSSCVFFSTIASMLIICLDGILLSCGSKVKLSDLKNQKKQNKRELSEKKQYLLELHAHDDELTNQLFTLKKNIDKEYQNLPTTLQKDTKIKEKILSLDKDNK